MMKKKIKCMFEECDNENAFIVLEIISSGQTQYKVSICRFVENFTGYQNI